MSNAMYEVSARKPVRFALAAVACALAMVAALCACGCSSNDDGAVAASAGDVTIYEEQVTNYTDQFRAENGLAEDAQKWTAYLAENNLTAQTWREQAVRTLVNRALVEKKALELGIKVDDAAVAEKLAELKKSEGVADVDAKAWEEHLSKNGRTPEGVLDSCRYDVLEQQVIKKALGYEGDVAAALGDEYVKENLAGKTVRRYEAAEFALDKKEKAQDYLDEMKRLELDGEDFEARLAEVVIELTGDKKADGSMKSIGWDFAYDEQKIDPKLKLRGAELDEDEVYKKVLSGTDMCRIVRCAEKVELGKDATFASIESKSLAKLVKKQVEGTLWEDKCAEYLQSLEQGAGLQIEDMPSGLSYDVQE